MTPPSSQSFSQVLFDPAELARIATNGEGKYVVITVEYTSTGNKEFRAVIQARRADLQNGELVLRGEDSVRGCPNPPGCD